MNWGNATVTSTEKVDGVTVLHANSIPEDKVYKGTKKLHWVAVDKNTNVTITIVEFDHLITK